MELNNQKGFTLIEVMITLVIGTMITGAAYATYTSQQRAYYTQDQVAEMQQNLRAAFSRMANELRMAGYDPEGSGLFGIASALPGRVQFRLDLNEDGVLDGDETFDIGFSTTIDGDGDGIPDANTPSNLGFQMYNTGGGGGFQAIAENIQAVEFLYLKSDETIAANTSEICNIQISILAASPRKDDRFTNTTAYTLATPSTTTWGPYNDNLRRRLLTLRIRCRNLCL